MAQRKCRDCGKIVSIQAKQCPGCGNTKVNSDLEWYGKVVARYKKLKKPLYIVGIICVIMGVGGFVSAAQFLHYIYSLISLAIGVGALYFPTYGIKKTNKEYNEYLGKVVVD